MTPDNEDKIPKEITVRQLHQKLEQFMKEHPEALDMIVLPSNQGIDSFIEGKFAIVEVIDPLESEPEVGEPTMKVVELQ